MGGGDGHDTDASAVNDVVDNSIDVARAKVCVAWSPGVDFISPVVGIAADVEGDVSEGASAGATTVGNVACGDANDAAFASRAAVLDVEADFRKAISDDERLPFWPVPVPEVRGLFELQHK